MSDDHDLANGIFMLGRAVESLSLAIETLGSPVLTVSEAARDYVTAGQIVGIDNSFLKRTIALKELLAEVKLRSRSVQTVEALCSLQSSLQDVRDRYLESEQVFDYYVDLLNTRSERNMGAIVRGCDVIAYASLQMGFRPLGLDVPTTVCYLDRGLGASILKAGIYLWDRQTNPAAIIKVVRSAVPLPRISAILHECGHQAAHITSWNQEMAGLLRDTVLQAGGSVDLGQLWASWASEVAADFWAIHQSNFASVVGLSEVVAGRPDRVFMMVPGDPHPMGYLRVLVGTTACRLAFGTGPWDDFARAWQRLYPLSFAGFDSAGVVSESIPLLEKICMAVSRTKMKAFRGNSLEQILPVAVSSPEQVKNMLNKDLSDFSADTETLAMRPILALIGFRVIHMFGGRPIEWISEKMRNWLASLSIERLKQK